MTKISSPCVAICKIDRKSGWCLGCYRTADEILTWAKMSNYQRRAALKDRAKRKEKLDAAQKK